MWLVPCRVSLCQVPDSSTFMLTLWDLSHLQEATPICLQSLIDSLAGQKQSRWLTALLKHVPRLSFQVGLLALVCRPPSSLTVDTSSSQNSGGMSSTYSELSLLKPHRTIQKLMVWLSECITNLRRASKQGPQLQLGALNSPSSSWACILPSRKILVLQLPNWSMALLFISLGTSFTRHHRWHHQVPLQTNYGSHAAAATFTNHYPRPTCILCALWSTVYHTYFCSAWCPSISISATLWWNIPCTPQVCQILQGESWLTYR